MARPQRTEAAYEPLPATPSRDGPAPSPWGEPGGDAGYRPGGQVGQMQADLAQRLAVGLPAPAIAPDAAERAVRFVSRAGGYAALLAGYGVVALLVLR